MKFTKGLFLGTALGISAAMMMNNKTTSTNAIKTNNPSNLNKTDTYQYSASPTDIIDQPQTNNYIDNDII